MLRHENDKPCESEIKMKIYVLFNCHWDIILSLS